MDITVLITIACILAEIKSASHSTCPSSWPFYEREKACIRSFTGELSWYYSRVHCQSHGADLVQIWDKEKERFVKGIIPTLSTAHWVGGIDWDKDGTFEYIDGTKMPTLENGWSVVQDTNNTHPSCLIMTRDTPGWKGGPCVNRHVFICEKYVGTIKKRETKDLSTCTPEYCFCKKKDWFYFKHGDKFIKPNRVKGNFSTSALLCEKLGGQLLTVSDSQTQIFVKDKQEWWNPRTTSYWMGLSREANEAWKWMDGSKLNSDEYQNWSDAETIRQAGCVVVMWGSGAKWQSTVCSVKHYHICEATVPCGAYPVLSINNQIPPDNTNIFTVTNEQDVIISCSYSGYSSSIYLYKVTCGPDQQFKSGKKALDIEVRIDITMHEQKCACLLVLYVGLKRKTTFTIDFKTQPRLVDDNINNKTFFIEIPRDEFVQEFVIYSNPRPASYTLTKSGSELVKKKYDVSITPLEVALHHSVVIILFDMDLNRTGTYVFTIDNGIDERLEYIFTVKAKYNKKESMTFAIALGVILFILLATCLGMGWVWKREDQRRRTQDSDDQLYSHVYDNRSSDRSSVLYVPNGRSILYPRNASTDIDGRELDKRSIVEALKKSILKTSLEDLREMSQPPKDMIDNKNNDGGAKSVRFHNDVRVYKNVLRNNIIIPDAKHGKTDATSQIQNRNSSRQDGVVDTRGNRTETVEESMCKLKEHVRTSESVDPIIKSCLKSGGEVDLYSHNREQRSSLKYRTGTSVDIVIPVEKTVHFSDDVRCLRLEPRKERIVESDQEDTAI